MTPSFRTNSSKNQSKSPDIRRIALPHIVSTELRNASTSQHTTYWRCIVVWYQAIGQKFTGHPTSAQHSLVNIPTPNALLSCIRSPRRFVCGCDNWECPSAIHVKPSINSKLAHDQARKNLEKKSTQRPVNDEKLSLPKFTLSDQVSIRRPYTESAQPDAKRNSRWHSS